MAGWDGNGLFTFTYNWVNDAANGVPITASRMDGQFNDAISGFDNCLTRDNQGKPSANFLPDTDNAYTMGGLSFRWSTGYFVGLSGTATNNNAAAGNIGEFAESTVLVGGGASVVSGVVTNITSLSLTAGDWETWGNIALAPSGGATITGIQGWMSQTSGMVPTYPNTGGIFLLGGGLSIQNSIIVPVGRQRQSLASTTTVYLTGDVLFSGGAVVIYGYLAARRIR